MIPSEWFPHRREDGEVVGYLEPRGDVFLPHDLLGRPLGPAVEWLEGEQQLEQLGIGWLAEPHRLAIDGGRRVRIVQLDAQQLTLVDDEFGRAQAVGAAGDAPQWVFPLPLTVGLTPWPG